MADNSAGRSKFDGPGGTRHGGLYDGFEGYRTPTDRDYHKVLSEGLIIPDTNVFLSLYRYNQQARSDLLAVMSNFGDRLFVPSQVMIEFWRNRENVLRDPLQSQTLAKDLDGYRTRSIEAMRNWANRAGFRDGRTQELSSKIDAAYNAVLRGLTEVIEEEGGGFATDTGSDSVLAELEKILMGRVGAGLDDDEYREALTEARRRVDSKIPPGYMDASKKGEGFAGDYLIWLQIMREAEIRKCNVLVVTGDAKEDWWRRERGELRGPRPELVREIKEVADAKLFMLRPDSFLIRAQGVLPVRIHGDSVKDVERVTDQSDTGDIAEFSASLIHSSWDEILATMKSRSKVAWVLLGGASILEVSGMSVTIEFQRRANGEAFIKRRFDQILAEIMSEFFNADVDVMVAL
jgi:hypothetical protein